MVAINFDASQFEPSSGGQDIFETGDYLFHITGSKTVPTSDKTGTMLVLDAKCLEPALAGKVLVIRLNVVHAKPETVGFAMRDLSAISYCVGVPKWQDSQQLHGRPFRIRVEKDPEGYTDNKGVKRPSNNIKAYMDANGKSPSEILAAGAPGGAAPPAPPAPPVAPAAAPVAPPVAAAPVAAAPVADPAALAAAQLAEAQAKLAALQAAAAAAPAAPVAAPVAAAPVPEVPFTPPQFPAGVVQPPVADGAGATPPWLQQ